MNRLIFKLPVFWTGSKNFLVSNFQFGWVTGKNFVKNQPWYPKIILQVAVSIPKCEISFLLDTKLAKNSEKLLICVPPKKRKKKKKEEKIRWPACKKSPTGSGDFSHGPQHVFWTCSYQMD